MAEQHQTTIVGIFALTGLVILSVLILMFGGGRSLLANTYDINVQFDRGVVGVQDGQSVTLNGKRIGETKAVEFWNPDDVSEGIKVVVAIDEEYVLPAASRMEVATSIMGFGRPALEIKVGDTEAEPGTLTKDGKAKIDGTMIEMLDQVLPPEMQKTLIATAEGITALAEAMGPVMSNLETILEPRDVQQVDLKAATANLATLIERFDIALKSFNQLIGDEENANNLKILLANFRRISEQTIEFMGSLNVMTTEGTQFARQATGLVRETADSMDKMSGLVTRMDRTIQMLNEGRGTAGLMLKDKRLYEELVLSAKRMTKMLDEFREVLDMAKKGELKISPF